MSYSAFLPVSGKSIVVRTVPGSAVMSVDLDGQLLGMFDPGSRAWTDLPVHKTLLVNEEPALQAEIDEHLLALDVKRRSWFKAQQ